MRRVLLDDPFIDGAVLVRDVRGPAGDILARTGMRLNTRTTRALRERGIAIAFIEDAASVGLEVHPVVDLAGAEEGLARALQEATVIAARETARLVQQPTTRALEALRETRFVHSLDASGTMEALRTGVSRLVEGIRQVDAATGFLTDREPADDLLGHSVGVAALAVRIGAELGLSDEDLVWVGLAGCLHDMGLLIVPEEVRRTPVHLRTPGQQRRYEDHTALGEALLRPLERRAPALPVVAIEHHEEQSGGGFPRGLLGGNRILRDTRSEHPRITLVSEIVAVADRYERLVSGAPGEAPRSAAVARHLIADEAGARLNAEVAARFVDLIPRYPVGTDVTLQGADLEGFEGLDGARAVVVGAGVHRNRPIVRVYATPAGPVTATDLDLARQPSLALVPAGEPVAA